VCELVLRVSASDRDRVFVCLRIGREKEKERRERERDRASQRAFSGSEEYVDFVCERESVCERERETELREIGFPA
jgi:hypothetical protein